MLLVFVSVVVAAESFSPPPLIAAPDAPRVDPWAGFPQPPLVSTTKPGSAAPGAASAPPPPGLVPAPPATERDASGSQPPPPSTEQAAPTPERDFPFWQVRALATATVPTALQSGAFMAGLRAEVDVWRLSALLTGDVTGVTPFTLSDTQAWTGLVGGSVFLNRWVRVRLLGGVSAEKTSTQTTFAPTLAGTARVSWAFVAAEVAAQVTPLGAFQQADLRAGAIIVLGPLELHGGYRARFMAAEGALLSATPLAGPHVALGLAL